MADLSRIVKAYDVRGVVPEEFDVATARALGSAFAPATGHEPLQLFQALRPIGLEQPRKRPVGEKPTPGLTGRAVVRLVPGVDDALHR